MGRLPPIRSAPRPPTRRRPDRGRGHWRIQSLLKRLQVEDELKDPGAHGVFGAVGAIGVGAIGVVCLGRVSPAPDRHRVAVAAHARAAIDDQEDFSDRELPVAARGDLREVGDTDGHHFSERAVALYGLAMAALARDAVFLGAPGETSSA